MKPASSLCGVLAAMLALSASPIAGQRIQFPSALPTNTAAAPAYGAPSGAAPSFGASAAPVSPPAAMPQGLGMGAAAVDDLLCLTFRHHWALWSSDSAVDFAARLEGQLAELSA